MGQRSNPAATVYKINTMSYGVIVALFWSLIVAYSLFWNYSQRQETALSLGKMWGQAFIEKDVLYRRWVSLHGGLYVPVTQTTQPDPNLSHIPERDITTPSGKQLTLMSPDYMTRQVSEMAQRYKGVGHEGDARGGLSVSVEIKTIYDLMAKEIRGVYINHAFIWLLGLGVIGIGTCKLDRNTTGLLEKNIELEHEIEERRKAHNEIESLNVELEQRVVERTAQIEAANKEMEAFCYSVSHDLSAPLRHIDGYVDLLVSRCRGGLNDKGVHYLDTIADSADKMAVLIDGLLQFSRTGRTEMHHETLDMNRVLQEALDLLKESCSERTIEWDIAHLPAVRGDCTMLRQVWVNLLDNAVKYTRSRESARIEVNVREELGEIIFVVKDNGVGFDMQYAGKLFGVFQRLHSQQEFEGTGIGLATVQRIINRHGGRVWAEAEPDQGAAFCFALPALKMSGRGNRV